MCVLKRRYTVFVQPLDLNKYSDVRQVISRNLTSGQQSVARQRAPLATPEHIEIGDYAQVKVSTHSCKWSVYKHLYLIASCR